MNETISEESFALLVRRAQCRRCFWLSILVTLCWFPSSGFILFCSLGVTPGLILMMFVSAYQTRSLWAALLAGINLLSWSMLLLTSFIMVNPPISLSYVIAVPMLPANTYLIYKLWKSFPIHYGLTNCQNCGYSLKCLTEPRCPECGTSFDPKLISFREDLTAEEEEAIERALNGLHPDRIAEEARLSRLAGESAQRVHRTYRND